MSSAPDPSSAGPATRFFVFLGTILIIIALAALPLLTPFFIHPALDAAESARRLGMEADVAHAMSDRSVEELVLGPGTFAFAGPDGAAFYDDSERSHLRDARVVLWLFMGLGITSALGLAVALWRARPGPRRSMWRTVSHAGAATAIVVAILGVISLVAFSSLFTLFHQVFFPAGNWVFDASTQRLVQLYPFAFWQIAAGALGVLVFVFGISAWLMGRLIARRTSVDAAVSA